MGNAAVGGAAPNTVFSSVRSREYLTGAEIERFMAAARASSRYALANAGHDTRALQAWLGHKNIQHTVRYTERSPTGSRSSWR